MDKVNVPNRFSLYCNLEKWLRKSEQRDKGKLWA